MSSVNLSSTQNTIPVTVGPIPEDGIQFSFAATESQLEVWLSSQQSVEANCAYNEICSLEFRGALDAERFKAAVGKVVARHPMLRARFSTDGQNVLVQRSGKYDFEFADLSQLTPEKQHQTHEAIVQKAGRQPFDLIHDSPLRVQLQKMGEQYHIATFTAHHLVLDGWSLSLFCRDLGHFYDTLSGLPCDSLPPVNRYDDYANRMSEYLASEAGRLDEKYWVEQYADRIPVLDLPTEFRRPPLRTYSAMRTDFTLSADLVERARKAGAKHGCSLFNVMLASFSTFVSRITHQDDFCIGIPSSGQAAMSQPELIGHCVNTMPYRTQVDLDQSFVDQLKSTRSRLLDSIEHQRYSYGTLLRKLAPPRDPSRPPMLSMSFNIDPAVNVNEIGFQGMDLKLRIEPREFEHFDWFINGVIHEDQSIEFQVQHNSGLYSTEIMGFYLEGFATFLECLIDAPEAPLKTHHLMSIPQRQQTIVEWNATSMEYPTDASLHAEFSRQANLTPDEIAIRFEDSSLTYREVEQRSNQLANYLRSQGVDRGDLVGICVERSDRMLVYLYAILKSGAGYVPLDPAYPGERLQYMCDHSGLKLIVTEDALTKQVTELNKPFLAVDAKKSEIGRLDSNAIADVSRPEDICYVIYTSGSTGKPKGVQVPHGAVVNFLYAMRQTPGFTAGNSVLAVTTLSFDIAVLELYLPTITGGSVVVVDNLTAADGVKLANHLVHHDITVMQATPATWRLMIQAGWTGKDDLKVLCGGEPMPSDLVQPLLDRCGELWNMYGPTETTVWSAAFQIESAEAPILIGKPIGNTQIYILDKNGNEVPVGCEGEVYIGGAGVTLGYRNRDDLTAERFVTNRYRNPFVAYVNDRLYKTGDLARFQSDGNIQFLRRNDKQVKVRGFRIELGEIETALSAIPQIHQNVVIVREDSVGDARLVAYFVAKSGIEFDANHLREQLRQTLPYYMIPQHFVSMDAFPQTDNGKIDYKQLPAPTSSVSESSHFDSPHTPAQQYLASVWSEVLETQEIDINDTFFDIGGHSLLVMRVIAQVHEKTGVKLGPQDFLIGTLEQLADQLTECSDFVDPSGSIDSEAVNTFGNETEMTEPELSVNNQAKPKLESVIDQSKSLGVFRSLKGFWD